MTQTYRDSKIDQRARSTRAHVKEDFQRFTDYHKRPRCLWERKPSIEKQKQNKKQRNKQTSKTS